MAQDIVTTDITDTLLMLAERQAIYIEAVAGVVPATEEDSFSLLVYLISKAAFGDGDLSASDRHILMEMASHSAITFAETLRRFYAAVLEASVTGTVDCPPVIASAGRLMRP